MGGAEVAPGCDNVCLPSLFLPGDVIGSAFCPIPHLPSLHSFWVSLCLQAKVSVLDSAFMLGDGVWEGLRLHQGVIMFAQQHLNRLWEGAKALDMELGITKQQLMSHIYNTLDANGMGTASGNARGEGGVRAGVNGEDLGDGNGVVWELGWETKGWERRSKVLTGQG